MNWVGGSLNRSRHNRNDAAVAAQKKHFAKVRAGYGPVKISPPSMAPLLPNWMQSSGTPFDAGRGRLLPQPDNQNQKRLEDFKTTRPLAQKLDSLQSRQQPLKRKLEVPRAESNGSRRLSKQTAQGTRSSPMTISSKASSTPSSSATRSKSPPRLISRPRKPRILKSIRSKRTVGAFLASLIGWVLIGRRRQNTSSPLLKRRKRSASVGALLTGLVKPH